jgi:hypothetical protein
MAMQLLPVPAELMRVIFSFDATHRPQYGLVMKELELTYNMGLWWLSTIQMVEMGLDDWSPIEMSEEEWDSYELPEDDFSYEMCEAEMAAYEDENMYSHDAIEKTRVVYFTDYDAGEDICMQALYRVMVMDEIKNSRCIIP